MKMYECSVKIKGREVTFRTAAETEQEAREQAQRWARHYSRAVDSRGVVKTFMPLEGR